MRTKPSMLARNLRSIGKKRWKKKGKMCVNSPSSVELVLNLCLIKTIVIPSAVIDIGRSIHVCSRKLHQSNDKILHKTSNKQTIDSKSSSRCITIHPTDTFKGTYGLGRKLLDRFTRTKIQRGFNSR